LDRLQGLAEEEARLQCLPEELQLIELELLARLRQLEIELEMQKVLVLKLVVPLELPERQLA
jgi:hypothetical protein